MSTESQDISARLRKVLNTHGHGFHYAVVRKAEELFSSNRSIWLFDAVEFPVVTQDSVTHIDFVLRSRNDRTILVGECKRADPAKAIWCFAASPYTRRNGPENELIIDHLQFQHYRTIIHKPHHTYTQRGVYHLGFELRDNSKKGDGSGQSSAAIDQAVTQVLRGTSGLIDHHSSISDWDDTDQKPTKAVRFLSAIFTTAQIWTTDADLSQADLETGDFSTNSIQANRTDWVWFNHNRSPKLKPKLSLERVGGVLSDLSVDLPHQFTRSIAIVSTSGIDSFLCADLDEWLW
jgi:hypothetical protein